MCLGVGVLSAPPPRSQTGDGRARVVPSAVAPALSSLAGLLPRKAAAPAEQRRGLLLFSCDRSEQTAEKVRRSCCRALRSYRNCLLAQRECGWGSEREKAGGAGAERC